MPAGLRERLEEDYKAAMKRRDELAVSTLRMARAEVSRRDLEGKGALDEAGIQAAIRTMLKQRADSSSEFRKGGRPELADKEEKEAAILKGYLPAGLPDEEIEKAVDAVLAATPGAAAKDLGRLMGSVMKSLAGRNPDGARVRALLQKRLAP